MASFKVTANLFYAAVLVSALCNAFVLYAGATAIKYTLSTL